MPPIHQRLFSWDISKAPGRYACWWTQTHVTCDLRAGGRVKSVCSSDHTDFTLPFTNGMMCITLTGSHRIIGNPSYRLYQQRTHLPSVTNRQWAEFAQAHAIHIECPNTVIRATCMNKNALLAFADNHGIDLDSATCQAGVLTSRPPHSQATWCAEKNI